MAFYRHSSIYFKQCLPKRGVLTKTNLDSCDVCISQGAQQQINNYIYIIFIYNWKYI